MAFWQKCVWIGAALLIVISLLSITQTAQTSSPAVQTASHTAGDPEYFSFQDTSRSETHYVVREGDKTVIYNSVPSGH